MVDSVSHRAIVTVDWGTTQMHKFAIRQDGRVLTFEMSQQHMIWFCQANFYYRHAEENVTDTGVACRHIDLQSLKEHLISDEIADVTLFFGSGKIRVMTGQTLVIDGGGVVAR